LAIVNNIDKEIKQEYLDALQSKGANYILWDQRHKETEQQKLRA